MSWEYRVVKDKGFYGAYDVRHVRVTQDGAYKYWPDHGSSPTGVTVRELEWRKRQRTLSKGNYIFYSRFLLTK